MNERSETDDENVKIESETESNDNTAPKRRKYNTKAMRERQARIISATLELIEEGGIGAATIRDVSKRANVALRTLYLYFENREAMIGSAIKDFFYTSISQNGVDKGPQTLAEVLDRFDRLEDIILQKRAYSRELAPVFFSTNLDPGIHKILSDIAISHVVPYLDDLVAAQPQQISNNQLEFLKSQIANIEYSIIDNCLSGRIPEQRIHISLKVGVLAFIAGYVENPPDDLVATLREMQQAIA
ncbi:MAG TPA: TetR/AcrR family transcriptional regulator [Parasphingorhabdus sp.]